VRDQLAAAAVDVAAADVPEAEWRLQPTSLPCRNSGAAPLDPSAPA